MNGVLSLSYFLKKRDLKRGIFRIDKTEECYLTSFSYVLVHDTTVSQVLFTLYPKSTPSLVRITTTYADHLISM